MKISAVGVSIILIAQLLTACTSTDPGNKESVLRLTFDGESCSYDGPTWLKRGSVTLHINNDSDVWAIASFLRHTGDETIQDVIDYIGDEAANITSPGWAHHLGVYQNKISAGESFSW